MGETNNKRSRKQANRKAFIDVLGDPFAIPEPIDGWYNRMKNCSSVTSMKKTIEQKCTINPAKPTAMDFYCDVERIIQEEITDKILLHKFIKTYIVGETDLLSASQRSQLEQRIGQLFRDYKISPVSKYFTTIRKHTRKKRG